MCFFQSGWVYQTKPNWLALFLIITGLSVLTQDARAQSCPGNTFEISRQETAAKIRLRCACAPGTKFTDGRCKEYIPRIVLKKASAFIVAGSKGEVRAFIKTGSQEYEVSTKLVLAANNIVTGKDSYIVLQLPSGKRLTIGQNTGVIFGDPLDEYDLNLLQVQGHIRFDNPSKTEQVRKLARRAFGRTKVWVRKAMSRRFRVRTPTACACVRGTDFLIEGTDTGDQIVRVVEGELDLIPHSKPDRNTVSMKAGQQALMKKDGRISRLEDMPPALLLSDWVSRTGLSKLPTYRSR